MLLIEVVLSLNGTSRVVPSCQPLSSCCFCGIDIYALGCRANFVKLGDREPVRTFLVAYG